MNLEEAWDVQATAAAIVAAGHRRVTLQFPDELLRDAALVAASLQSELAAAGSTAQVFVLADTTYNPLSVDEVAAAHVNADIVVHYGHASLNPVSRVPALCVLPKAALDVQSTCDWVAQQLTELSQAALDGVIAAVSSNEDDSVQQQQQQPCRAAVLCCDQGYLHLLQQLEEGLRAAYPGPLQLVAAHSAPLHLMPQGDLSTPISSALGAKTDTSSDQPISSSSSSTPPVGGLVWQLPPECQALPPLLLWLGPSSSAALTHLQLTYATTPWLRLDPVSRCAETGVSSELQRLLKRRYYLTERTRAATMVGLLVGTLGAAGYKTALRRLRRLAEKAGKRTYTLLMGKPSPAKLANFPEIEVFVLLADPQGAILDCREYLAPIVTPHEAWLAFTGRSLQPESYKLDFSDLLRADCSSDSGEEDELRGGGGSSSAISGSHRNDTKTSDIGGNVNDDVSDSSDGGNGSSGDNNIKEQATVGLSALVLAGSGGGASGGGSSTRALTGSSSRTGAQLSVRSAAQYLAEARSYRGLETPATGAELLPPSIAVEGRSGRAAGYTDEPPPAR